MQLESGEFLRDRKDVFSAPQERAWVGCGQSFIPGLRVEDCLLPRTRSLRGSGFDFVFVDLPCKIKTVSRDQKRDYAPFRPRSHLMKVTWGSQEGFGYDPFSLQRCDLAALLGYYFYPRQKPKAPFWELRFRNQSRATDCTAFVL